jgi:hypothetical protein
MVDYQNSNDARDEKGNSERPGDDDDVQAAQPKPTVHYPEHVHQTPAPGYPHHMPPKFESRASSVIGTDDEHDDEDGENYDWSGEEDLEEQQVEYEKQVGIKHKPQGWGIKRYALNPSMT